jgi:hypothetical protein
VQFEQRYGPAIADGSLTLTFRRWVRPQVIAGRRYRTAAGMLEVEAIEEIPPADITDADAARAGYPSAAALFADLRGSDATPLYRVKFHAVAGPDPRDELAAEEALTADDVAELDRRLERLDRAGKEGPWTMAVLRVIAERPAVRAPDLAASFGRDTLAFKLDVRRLKALGLTLSLRIGYRLSPRGEAYLRLTSR